jgi:hypothetical protein
MAVRASKRRLGLASVVGAVLLAIALLIPPAAAEARKGSTVSDTARYRYKVTAFDYSAYGDVVAARDPGGPGICEPAEDQGWIGHAATNPALLSGLVPGKGSLKIHERGTSGKIEAGLAVDSSFGPAEHEEVTECDHDPGSPHYQQQTNSTTTECSDQAEGQVEALVTIAGGVGDRVKLDWRFSLDNGSWVPNTFECNGPFHYPDKSCVSRASLNQFTGKNVKLSFLCRADSTAPPPGVAIDYSMYVSQAQASGFLKLKRTKQS